MLERCGEEGIIHHTLDLLVNKYYWRLSTKIENSGDTEHRGRILGQGSEAKAPELAKCVCVWGGHRYSSHPHYKHVTRKQTQGPMTEVKNLGFWILR